MSYLVQASAQEKPSLYCGQKDIAQQLFNANPAMKRLHEQIEDKLLAYKRAVQSGALAPTGVNAIVTLPVIVHIIHNNGAENISDAQVFTGIQHLNEAFANTGYYDPADGVNTNIQFCMAQRDPNNNATNGITRNVSAYTVMGGAAYYSDDQNVKNINRWNPDCYINIWLVRSIPGNMTGYAYLPFAHGTNIDGIVMEAGFFGSSYANDVVTVHEMGHYLGLYHTFEGGCTNNNCNTDGDKVCDTPPDQTTAVAACNQTVNSCSTDALSGFSIDVNDLTQDYMDYGNLNCMKVFTQGQADRMNWYISNVRASLLACKSCMAPCATPVIANFTVPAPPFNAGTPYTFTNTSLNAASSQWYVNGVLQAAAGNLAYTFPTIGADTIRLVAHSSDGGCMDNEKSVVVQALCPAKASFTKSAATAATGATINFTNTSTNANTYEWFVDGVSQSTATNFSYTTTNGGSHVIKLVAGNTTFGCQNEFTDMVTFNCSFTASFSPAPVNVNVDAPVVFNSTGAGATHWHWYVNGVAAGSDSVALIYMFPTQDTYTIRLAADNGTCTSTVTSYVYVGNQCNNPSGLFQKSYAIGAYSSAAHISATSDGGSVVATSLQINNADVNVHGAILKLDATGNVIWGVDYNTSVSSWLSKVHPTADGGYIAIGSIGSTQSLFIVKTDGAGLTQWTREYPGSYGVGADILQGADGSYYFTATGGYTGLIAGKVDNTGALAWMKTYFIFYEDAASIAEDNNFIVIAGDTYNHGGTGMLLKVQKANGNLVWGKKYTSTNEFFMKVLVAPDGYYVLGNRANTTTSDFSDIIFLKTDFNGNLTWSKYQQPFGSNKNFTPADILFKGNGNLACFLVQIPGNNLLIQEISTAGVVTTGKSYNNNVGYPKSFAKRADEGLLLTGNITEPVDPTYRSFVMRMDPAGNAGNCPPTAATVSLINFAPVATAITPTVTAINPTPVTNHVPTPVVVDRVECQLANCNPLPTGPPDTCGTGCTTTGIAGAAGICDKSADYTYLLQRNSNCPAVPVWSIDPAFATVVSTTDSTIVLHFTGNGSAVLHSTLTTHCKVWQDSVSISIHAPSDALNLGPDIALCKASIYTLHAGNSFAAYRWQDGSADSTFTLYNPGTYYVETTDRCGSLYHDTVLVTQAPNVPFSMVNSMAACKQDTITLTAPGGFVKYYWSPDYNINNRYAAGIKIVANTDTLYTVVAEKAPGCLVVDTMHLKVNQPTPVALGNDTSICKFDTLTINAGSGFNSYSWNTGALSQSIRVGAAGKYDVTATDMNNCKSRDTLQIINVYALPPVNLGADKAICSDSSVVFDAGGGNAYAWQDGSAGSTFTASLPGTYWVRITDANGCHNADTVLITGFRTAPAGFLPQDTAFCVYQQLELQSTGHFVQYKWSNNSTSDAIVVNAAGDYWLQVIDTAGCGGTDTVHVTTKDCTKDVFIPNAFTPGKGVNNIFRAVVHGDLENFSFTIFNRWGQKVFSTQDPSRGWDGTYNSVPASAGTFVWICTYKLIGPGQVQTTKRGMVVLIR